MAMDTAEFQFQINLDKGGILTNQIRPELFEFSIELAAGTPIVEIMQMNPLIVQSPLLLLLPILPFQVHRGQQAMAKSLVDRLLQIGLQRNSKVLREEGAQTGIDKFQRIAIGEQG